MAAVLCSEAIVVNKNNDRGVAATLRCRRWSCPICHPFNRKDVVKKGKRGKPNAFLTLTCNPHLYETPDDAARDLKEAWVTLRRRIFKRYAIKNIPFLAVFERTKAGWPHMHILLRAPWISQKWLSDQMRDLTGAHIVDIRKIDNEGRAAAYVSKYVGKDPHVFKGCKRWWRSHNYEVAKDDAKPKIMFGARWEQDNKTIDQYKNDLVKMGYYITEDYSGYIAFERWYVHLRAREKLSAL